MISWGDIFILWLQFMMKLIDNLTLFFFLVLIPNLIDRELSRQASVDKLSQAIGCTWIPVRLHV